MENSQPNIFDADLCVNTAYGRKTRSSYTVGEMVDKWEAETQKDYEKNS